MNRYETVLNLANTMMLGPEADRPFFLVFLVTFQGRFGGSLFWLSRVSYRFFLFNAC